MTPPVGNFEYLELETPKVCKSNLKRQNGLRRKLQALEIKRCTVFKRLEIVTFDFGPKYWQVLKIHIFQAKKEGYKLIRIKEKQLKEEYDAVIENISSTVGKECR